MSFDARRWRECAGATINVRVIPSRRPESERVEEEESGLEERVIQGERGPTNPRQTLYSTVAVTSQRSRL